MLTPTPFSRASMLGISTTSTRSTMLLQKPCMAGQSHKLLVTARLASRASFTTFWQTASRHRLNWTSSSRSRETTPSSFRIIRSTSTTLTGGMTTASSALAPRRLFQLLMTTPAWPHPTQLRVSLQPLPSRAASAYSQKVWAGGIKWGWPI